MKFFKLLVLLLFVGCATTGQKKEEYKPKYQPGDCVLPSNPQLVINMTMSGIQDLVVFERTKTYYILKFVHYVDDIVELVPIQQFDSVTVKAPCSTQKRQATE